MKKIEIKRFKEVLNPDVNDVIKSFQLVEFSINFFGTVQKTVLDTKILRTGQQLVINGDGWIKDGFDITHLI